MSLFIRKQMPAHVEDAKKRTRMHYSAPHRHMARHLIFSDARYYRQFGWSLTVRDRDIYDLLMRGA